jgi:hypothetical protein
MDSAGVLEVEAIQGCGRAHARDNALAHKQIKRRKPT